MSLPRRKPNRLSGYDYSREGAYFITLCAKERQMLFGAPCNLPDKCAIPRFVSTLKRFTNKKAEADLWQRGYHDHVIRGDKDCQMILQYIETNPQRWQKDCFYRETKP